MKTFKDFSKYFCGVLVLAFCLFGGAGVVEGKTVDLNMQDIDVSIPAGKEVTPDYICRMAGYGSCVEVNGIMLLRENPCGSAAAGGSDMRVVNNCNDKIITGGERRCARIGAVGFSFKCEAVRGWGLFRNPDNVPDDFNQSIKSATDWILGFVGMIAVLMIIWGGINYLTSAGDEDKARTGKKTISYALIGLVIAGIAYAIVDVIITVIL